MMMCEALACLRVVRKAWRAIAERLVKALSRACEAARARVRKAGEALESHALLVLRWRSVWVSDRACSGGSAVALVLEQSSADDRLRCNLGSTTLCAAQAMEPAGVSSEMSPWCALEARRSPQAETKRLASRAAAARGPWSELDEDDEEQDEEERLL